MFDAVRATEELHSQFGDSAYLLVRSSSSEVKIELHAYTKQDEHMAVCFGVSKEELASMLPNISEHMYRCKFEASVRSMIALNNRHQ